MEDAKKQLGDKLKTANNVLVTVSRNPSVDQLSALLGFTLLLNKQGKHAAAVFSGEVPSTLEFLKPEETIEKNTDSLRDFIIALDKHKADKLRYKVEDDVVRIFITPYKTSISEADFEFSQGDFNVDLVVALGVQRQEDLDDAITAHGRILHDATVASVNTSPDGGVGTINWHDAGASSLSELVTELGQGLGDKLFDEQIATALMTGIVSETARFSNEKTSARTMSLSSVLMAAGANQQLVASKLEAPAESATNNDASAANPPDYQPSAELPKPEDGEIEIDHGEADHEEPSQTDEKPETEAESESGLPAIKIDENTGEFKLHKPDEDHQESSEEANSVQSAVSEGSKLVTEPPSLGGTLTANSSQPRLDPSVDPFSLPNAEPPQLLDRKDNAGPVTPTPEPSAAPVPVPAPTPPPPPAPAWIPPTPEPLNLTPAPAPETPPAEAPHTLTDLEQAVGSPHVNPENLNAARDEVSRALNSNSSEAALPPVQALNAQPVDLNLPTMPSAPGSTTAPQVIDPNAPPPVPPPIPFDFGKTPPAQ